MKDKIAKENNLSRCKCGKLIAKLSAGGDLINIKKSSLDMIAEVKSASIKCPKCGQINQVK